MVTHSDIRVRVEEINNHLGNAAICLIELSELAKKEDIIISDGQTIADFNLLADNLAQFQTWFDQMQGQLLWGVDGKS